MTYIVRRPPAPDGFGEACITSATWTVTSPGDVSIEDFSEKAAVREVFSELQAIGNDVIAESPEEARQRQRVLDLNRSPLDPMQLLDVGNSDSGEGFNLRHRLSLEWKTTAAPTPAPPRCRRAERSRW